MATTTLTLTQHQENYQVSVIYKQCLTQTKEKVDAQKQSVIKQLGLLKSNEAHEKAFEIIQNNQTWLLQEFEARLSKISWQYVSPQEEINIRKQGCIITELYGRMLPQLTQEMTHPTNQNSFDYCILI